MTYRISCVDARAADNVEAIARLHKLTFGPTNICLLTGFWWLAHKGREAVAFAGLQASAYYPNSGYFCRVGVLPSHRGQGLQRRLMRVVERKAKLNRWQSLYSDTNLNPHSAANFEKTGWHSFTPDKPWGHPTAIYWRKDL